VLGLPRQTRRRPSNHEAAPLQGGEPRVHTIVVERPDERLDPEDPPDDRRLLQDAPVGDRQRVHPGREE
jgi:hypothetical protein